MVINRSIGHLLSDHSNHAHIGSNEMTTSKGRVRHKPNSNTNKARKLYIYILAIATLLYWLRERTLINET